MESETFAVVPALGPLVAGHVMVIARDHIGSLAEVGEARAHEYEELRNRVAAHIGSEVLEAEHGSRLDGEGACIEHAHVNLIPGAHQHFDLLDYERDGQEVRGTLELQNHQPPYVYLRGVEGRLYRAAGLPSQVIRRELWARSGRDDWDWALFPEYQLVEETKACFGQ
jgi:diadenosine tetraphosphate (Ap4A) HIT family hydrolase